MKSSKLTNASTGQTAPVFIRALITPRCLLKARSRFGAHPLRMALLSATTAILLSACGGGGDGESEGNFNIGVTVGGTFINNTPVVSGGSIAFAVRAGQSVIVDAGEPVVWTMYVGGSAVSGGALVYYAGVEITATTLSRSTVAVDTYSSFLLQASVPITLVATSTYDSAQVATVNILITN